MKPCSSKCFITTLRHLDVWIPALRESCQIWKNFLIRAAQDDELLNEVHHYKALLHPIRGQTLLQVEERDLQRVEAVLEAPSRLRHREYKDALRIELDRYLTMINSALVLASKYRCGIFDWPDHGPFYRQKFLTIGAPNPSGIKESDAVKQLFQIVFPQLTATDPKVIMRVLHDKRITELRDLVHAAARNDVSFDSEFANRTLREVVKAEQRLGRLRKYLSYITLSLHFVPIIGTGLQKGIEELGDLPLERTVRKKLRWFYMLSEIAEEHTREPQ